MQQRLYAAIAAAAMAFAALTAPASGQSTDTAFAAVQARGSSARGMGVDQSTSGHRFDILHDGGRIELLREVDDSAGVAQIRWHLQAIARAFQAGDFTTPAFVHMRDVPGTDVMAARRSHITYVYRELPRGGEVRITSHDPQALAAIRQFMEFQRHDHHSGGAGADSTASTHSH